MEGVTDIISVGQGRYETNRHSKSEFFLRVQNLTLKKIGQENAQKILEKSHKRCKNMYKW